HYYAKDSGLEIDFVTAVSGEVVLVEVKATTGNTKSSREVLAHPETYGVNRCIKLGRYNIGDDGRILTLPHYAAFLVDELDGIL
ncbi:MAG: DUF4143 domain-containing protein, partial [archaeon]|nr:DUF4143 domain-containing protein [archaeon]